MTRGAPNRVAIISAVLFLAGPTYAQEDHPDLSGMYSDPAGLEDFFCFFWCSTAGLERLNELLDDPANDERPIMELYADAANFQREEYLLPRLSAEGTATLGVDPADDPGFLYCEPWGFAREIFSPHQVSFEQYDDRVEILYGEWTTRRTVWLDEREPPADLAASPMGYSTGRYDGDALVIETTAISANLAPWGWGFITAEPFDGRHSDDLTTTERYTRSEDGQRLILDVTLDDPWALRAPVTLKKVWHWAPDQEIAPYESCEPPTEFSRGVNPQ